MRRKNKIRELLGSRILVAFIMMMIKKILVNLTVSSNDSLGCMSQASKVEVNLSKLE